MTDASLESPAADAPPDPIAKPSGRAAVSLHKLALVGGLALATLLPNILISGLIEERETRQETVRKEFARNWGPQQQLQSPILVVPYQVPSGRPRQYLKIAAARLEIAANLDPQERRRGLFQATVYDARIEMQGTFVVPAEHRLRDLLIDKESRILWSESFIALATAASFTGLRSEDHVAVNGVATPWLPCLEAVRQEADCRGASAVLASAPLEPATRSTTIAFKSAISLRGTGSFGPRLGWQGARRHHSLAVDDAELRRRRPADEFQPDGARVRGALADRRVRLSAHPVFGRRCRSDDVERVDDRRRPDRDESGRGRPAQCADAMTADPAVQGIVFWILLFLTGVHLLVLTVLVGVEAVQAWASRAVVMLGGLTLVAIGNLLPRMRPNLSLGIRTERTIVDRHLWMLLHRTGGYICVLVGITTLLMNMFLSGPITAAVCGAAFVAAAVAMCVYYQKLTSVVSLKFVGKIG